MSAESSYSNEIAKDIDNVRFNQQFFQTKRGFFNHPVNPFPRTGLNAHIADPKSINVAPEDVIETSCCNKATATVVNGRKLHTPLENATYFWSEINTTGVQRTKRITDRIGLDQSENGL